jgi:hypothetical protein
MSYRVVVQNVKQGKRERVRGKGRKGGVRVWGAGIV